MPPRRLILRSFQSPGDIVMLTAAVRDLHLAHPGRFETDVRTSCDALWENNPNITRFNEGDAGVESLDMHYPQIHESNQRPYHFIHGYPQYLEQQLGLRVPVTAFHGDIHLSEEEKSAPRPRARDGSSSPASPNPPGCSADHRLPASTGPRTDEIPERFWIVVAGGKYDFTAKWWNPASYQAVVDHFRGKIPFVQCGEAGHWHPPLEGVVNLVGKTSTRDFLRLMHHACTLREKLVSHENGSPVNNACAKPGTRRESQGWPARNFEDRKSGTSGPTGCRLDFTAAIPGG